MRGWSQLTALGLRGRIVGAVLVTAVVTLAVAAAALLGPLESSLRNAAQTTFQGELRVATNDFARLSLANLPLTDRSGADARADLAHAQQQLGQRIGALVAVLGFPDATG